MSSLLIRNASVVHLDGVCPGCDVFCLNGRIAAVGAAGLELPGAADTVVDAAGAILAPGFIDLHIHGTHRYLIDNGPEDLAQIVGVLPRYGVTGFLPSVCPRPRGEDAEFVKRLSAVRADGARILGFHLEGPFLSRTGALPPEALGKADPGRVRALRAAAAPFPAVFSVSPDFDGIIDLLPIMREDRTPVFMTHTAATVKQTQAAIEAGVRHATHFYDVFPPPPESDPGVRPCGVVEAVLADPRVSVDFILDGEHVDPVAVQMALACKGPDRVCLITDANVGAGFPPGRYPFVGGAEVVFAREGGPARLTEKSNYPGALAGSGLTMDRALRNAVAMLGIDVAQAVRMVSTNPARVLGLDAVKGRIEKGFDADLVLLDGSLAVLRTWVGGDCRYERGSTRT